MDYEKLTGTCQRHTVKKYTVSNGGHNSTSSATSVQQQTELLEGKSSQSNVLDESHVSVMEKYQITDCTPVTEDMTVIILVVSIP